MPELKRLVVVANRLPVAKNNGQWVSSPGGLVRALEPILRDRHGAWVGWAGIADAVIEPFDHGDIQQRPVTLTAEEVESFYYGFCNGTLWPLYHDGVVPPEFHRHWWRPYEEVNRKYAAAADSVMGQDDIAWVQDYQLQLVPAMLRELRPQSTIGFYLHIPFPPIELFARLPWRQQIVEGILGADVVAFQTRRSADNFMRAARRIAGAESLERRQLSWKGRRVEVQRAPIAIDTSAFEELARSESVTKRASELRNELGQGARVILGVDRLDYTKGIDLRLKAFAGLLEESMVRRFAFVQVAVPSREGVPAYRRLRRDIEQIVGRINGQHGEPGWAPVTYLYRSLDLEELVAYYVTADVMMVTPLRDGMNLVAKEYVASRRSNDGVLLLSEFAGASEQLRSALKVNPYDVDGMTETLRYATEMPREEERRRMQALRRTVRKETVFEWAQRCLDALDSS